MNNLTTKLSKLLRTFSTLQGLTTRTRQLGTQLAVQPQSFSQVFRLQPEQFEFLEDHSHSDSASERGHAVTGRKNCVCSSPQKFGGATTYIELANSCMFRRERSVLHNRTNPPHLNNYISKRTYIIKRTKRKQKAKASSDDLEHAAHVELTNKDVPIAIQHQTGRHIISLPFPQAEPYIAEKFPSMQLIATKDTNEKGEKIFRLLPHKVKESVFTISAKIGPADLKVKMASMKKQLDHGRRVVIQLKESRKIQEVEQINFSNELKNMLEADGFSVQQFQGPQFSFHVGLKSGNANS